MSSNNTERDTKSRNLSNQMSQKSGQQQSPRRTLEITFEDNDTTIIGLGMNTP